MKGRIIPSETVINVLHKEQFAHASPSQYRRDTYGFSPVMQQVQHTEKTLSEIDKTSTG